MRTLGTCVLALFGAATLIAVAGLAAPPAIAQPSPMTRFECRYVLGFDLGAYDLDGHGRCIEITDSWVDPVLGGYRISYQLEYVSTGTTYTLVIDHGGAEPRLRVFGAGAMPEIMTKAVVGAGTTVTTAGGTVGSAWSPFVIDVSTIGGGVDTDALLLVDQQVLNDLPVPTRWTGPGAGSGPIMTAYVALVADHANLYDSFRFRADGATMTEADVTDMVAAIDGFIDDGFSEAIHDGPDGLADTDGTSGTDGIDHDVAIDTIDVLAGEFGGFWNGHRYLMRECEDYIQTAGGNLPPFGRLPAWDPGDAVPDGFAEAGIATGEPIPTELYAGTVCAYPDDTSTGPTNLFGFTDQWHGRVHAAFVTAIGHEDALFFLLHATVDVVWANWQQCQI